MFQTNKSKACPTGRSVCERSCAAQCNKTRNTTVLGRTVSAAPQNYQSFKAPQAASNSNTITNSTALLNSTRKTSTMLPAYEPTIIAGNSSVSKPCALPNATGINASAYNQMSKSYATKTSFKNV
nr:unnamed protein product [Callosobruchus chinensis]